MGFTLLGTRDADGEPGDLCIHGPSAARMDGGNRDKTRETFQGGWTKSRDKCIRNADISSIYRGRSDDMLKVSGIDVSPFDVAAMLVQHAAVLEAAVIGVPDPCGADQDQGLRQGQAGTVHVPAPDCVRHRMPTTTTGEIQRDKPRCAISRRARSFQASLRSTILRLACTTEPLVTSSGHRGR